LKNYRKWKKSKKNITFENLYGCLTRLDHFGMYWVKNPYFRKKEISDYFRDKTINEKRIYEFLLEHDWHLSGKAIEKVKYIGEKTPVNIFHLNEILGWFPEATILFIFRDPLMVLKSEANKKLKPDYPMKKSNPLYHVGIVVFVFLEWLFAGTIAIHHMKKRKDKLIIIEYERLINHKHEMVESLSKKLGITFNEKLYDVAKIGSSYSKEKQSYWEPSLIIKWMFKILNPVYNRLKQQSIR
jgi:hypothetical protein